LKDSKGALATLPCPIDGVRLSGLPNQALTWLLVCVSACALCSVEELNTKNDVLVGEIADSEAMIAKLMDAYVHPTATHALLTHLETAHLTCTVPTRLRNYTGKHVLLL
jgi:hypothetical protein